MRSDLIYAALGTVPNRYTLCQLASKATRRFHRPNTRLQETMNDVLTRINRASENELVLSATPELLANEQRRAA
jgi:hypothetical protein